MTIVRFCTRIIFLFSKNVFYENERNTLHNDLSFIFNSILQGTKLLLPLSICKNKQSPAHKYTHTQQSAAISPQSHQAITQHSALYSILYTYKFDLIKFLTNK